MFSDTESFRVAYLAKFAEIQGKPFRDGVSWERYQTLVLLIKEWIADSWIATNNAYTRNKSKQVFYFSMEFLIGKLLSCYLRNLGIKETVEAGLAELGVKLADLVEVEQDAGLGNGGLGRLAACFLDSMSFLGIPGHGNGIRYKYGLFQQKIIDGSQAEVADNWLNNGYPWEIKKPEKAIIVKFKGDVKTDLVNGRLTFTHENYEPILAVPYDIPMVSYQNWSNINTLRLWSAEPVKEEFDLVSFNRGEFSKAVSYRAEVESISYILYPEDSSKAGQELRLKQEYFFVAAGLGSIVRSYKKKHGVFGNFPWKVAIHINDTHPALCIPELMRIFMDEEGMSWEKAWNLTVNSISYTNHTIMPEALEKWPAGLLKYLLPRIYMIIEEIDRRYRAEIKQRYFDMDGLAERTAIISDGRIHMANLAVIGSHSVNGVSALHTEILKEHLLKDFHSIYPYKLNNKTNGVCHRRFLLQANPGLAELITEAIGEGWISKANELENLLPFQKDGAFLERLGKIKYGNKVVLADIIANRTGVKVNPASIFDVHVKRIHAYKRQLMNILRIMDIYNRIKRYPDLPVVPHTFIFAGKAAPGYHYAKTVIKLINAVGEKINNDPEIEDRLKVVFLENFNVSLAEKIYPAAEISQQISAASREASGTGNMKFMLNGAITLGTLDGANVEIKQAVGADNIAIFGMDADQVMNFYQQGGYHSWEEYHNFPRLKRVVDQLVDGFFESATGEFKDIYNSLLQYNDEFFILKDFSSYVDAWQRLNMIYGHQLKWQEMSLINIAKGGMFAGDRTVREYAKEIWRVPCRS